MRIMIGRHVMVSSFDGSRELHRPTVVVEEVDDRKERRI